VDRDEALAEGELDAEALADADFDAFADEVAVAPGVVRAVGFFDVQPTPSTRRAAINKAARFILHGSYRAGRTSAKRMRFCGWARAAGSIAVDE